MRAGSWPPWRCCAAGPAAPPPCAGRRRSGSVHRARRPRARRRSHAARWRAWHTPAGARWRAARAARGGRPRPIAGAHVLDVAAAAHGRTAVLLRTAGGLAVAGRPRPVPVPGTTDATQGRIAVDDAGHVVVVWVEPGSGTTLSIRSAVRTGATWSPPEFVDVGAGQTVRCTTSSSVRGAAHLLYGVSADGSAAEYLGSRPLGGAGWTAVTLAQTGAGHRPRRRPRGAVRRTAGGDSTCSAAGCASAIGRGARLPARCSARVAGAALARPALAQDARGDLLVAYVARRPGAQRRGARPTGTPGGAARRSSLHGAGAPALARLAGGDVVLAVRARGRVLACRRRSGSRAWTSRRLLASAGATGRRRARAAAASSSRAWPAADGVRARIASRRP